MYARGGRQHRASAIESFVAAMHIYNACGAAQPWIERAVEVKRKSLGGRAETPVGTAPDGLSAREVEVLRLVACGRSSKEIGEELVLSVRTVERHIANIYLKTGTHGRAQATSYAFAHGMAAPAP